MVVGRDWNAFEFNPMRKGSEMNDPSSACGRTPPMVPRIGAAWCPGARMEMRTPGCRCALTEWRGERGVGRHRGEALGSALPPPAELRPQKVLPHLQGAAPATCWRCL